jgi:small GTP-binding protein
MISARKKLVIVGDGGCGKTCLLTSFRDRRFNVDYVPTVFENCVVNVEYRRKKVETKSSHIIS